jgi:hypothetical protein
VDIAPEEDRIAVKKGIVRTLKPQIGENIFDGTMMFTINRLPSDPFVLSASKLPPRGSTGVSILGS